MVKYNHSIIANWRDIKQTQQKIEQWSRECSLWNNGFKDGQVFVVLPADSLASSALTDIASSDPSVTDESDQLIIEISTNTDKISQNLMSNVNWCVFFYTSKKVTHSSVS